MDKHDPDKKVALYVDEWGTWYDPEAGRNPGFLYQQNTLRDALVASLTLDIFHRHADRVKMANIAQMVNVLQAMILTDKEKMTLTPTYFSDMNKSFTNYMHRLEYCRFLLATKDHEELKSVLTELLDEFEHMKATERRVHREIIRQVRELASMKV